MAANGHLVAARAAAKRRSQVGAMGRRRSTGRGRGIGFEPAARRAGTRRRAGPKKTPEKNLKNI